MHADFIGNCSNGYYANVVPKSRCQTFAVSLFLVGLTVLKLEGVTLAEL